MAYKNTNPLRPICSMCDYRRVLGERGIGAYASTDRLHACLYILIEDGEPRGCTPTDDYCEKFKPRSINTKSLKGGREIFK